MYHHPFAPFSTSFLHSFHSRLSILSLVCFSCRSSFSSNYFVTPLYQVFFSLPPLPFFPTLIWLIWLVMCYSSLLTKGASQSNLLYSISWPLPRIPKLPLITSYLFLSIHKFIIILPVYKLINQSAINLV